MKVGRDYTHSHSTPISTGLAHTAWTLAIWAISGTLATAHFLSHDLQHPEPFMRAPVAFASVMAGRSTSLPSDHSRRPRVKGSLSEIERELQKMFYRPLFKAEPKFHQIHFQS